MELLASRATRGFESATVPTGVDKRISFLEPDDRKLLQLTLQRRVSRREAALLTGRTAGAVTRRIHTLMNRVNHPLVKALAERGDLLPADHQGVGLAYYLRGWSIRRISRDFHLSQYAVKRIIMYLRGWHRALTSSASG